MTVAGLMALVRQYANQRVWQDRAEGRSDPEAMALADGSHATWCELEIAMTELVAKSGKP